MRQLALPFLHRAAFPEDGFAAAASNAEARRALGGDAWREWPGLRLALHGEAGSGKTHLLHVWVGRLRKAGRDAALIEASALASLAADAELPARGGLAVDDADAATDERALLHLINRAAEDNIPLVLAARTAPSRWHVDLPDLRSRLRATLAIGIGDPEDELLDALFGRLLADRQLAVAPNVARFLRLRLPREAGALRAAVDRLDRIALEAGRAVSIATAQSLLAETEPERARESGDDAEASLFGASHAAPR